MDNMKNTWENVKKNLGIKLQTDLPPRGRQNWTMKRSQMQRGNHSLEQVVGVENV